MNTPLPLQAQHQQSCSEENRWLTAVLFGCTNSGICSEIDWHCFLASQQAKAEFILMLFKLHTLLKDLLGGKLGKPNKSVRKHRKNVFQVTRNVVIIRG